MRKRENERMREGESERRKEKRALRERVRKIAYENGGTEFCLEEIYQSYSEDILSSLYHKNVLAIYKTVTFQLSGRVFKSGKSSKLAPIFGAKIFGANLCTGKFLVPKFARETL